MAMAMEYKRRSETMGDGKTIMPGAGPVVVGLPGKNMRKFRNLRVYESDKTVLVNGVPIQVEGASIFVEKEEDLPGYRPPGERGFYDHGWVLVRTNVEVADKEIHRPGDGRVGRRALPQVSSPQPVKRTRANV